MGSCAIASMLSSLHGQQSNLKHGVQQWRELNFGSGDPAVIDQADPDNDGLCNIIEYALDLDPKRPDAAGNPKIEFIGDVAHYSFNRAKLDVAYVIEKSSDMENWTVLGAVSGGNALGMTRRALSDLETRDFYRLRVLELKFGGGFITPDTIQFFAPGFIGSEPTIHYRINNGVEQNLTMNFEDGRFTYTVPNIPPNSTVSYSVNYPFAPGQFYKTEFKDFTFSEDVQLTSITLPDGNSGGGDNGGTGGGDNGGTGGGDTGGTGGGDTGGTGGGDTGGTGGGDTGGTGGGDTGGTGGGDTGGTGGGDTGTLTERTEAAYAAASGVTKPTFADKDRDGVPDHLDAEEWTNFGHAVDEFGRRFEYSTHEVQLDGNVLVAGEGADQPGHALYVFDPDLGQESSVCTGGCAEAWPPLLVGDGLPSGVSHLGSITRPDGSMQVTYQGRPLYYFGLDTQPSDRKGDGRGGNWHLVEMETSNAYVPLYSSLTPGEPPLVIDTPSALKTYFADRARDRHGKEDHFRKYDHYLKLYWEKRTAAVEIIDTVGKNGPGGSITFNVKTQAPLDPKQAELRFFYRGQETVAEFHDNASMTDLEDNRYTRTITWNIKAARELQVGDRMEFELSQFLLKTEGFVGQDNYYGTTYLYVVGKGLVPWYTLGDFADKATEKEDSFAIPERAWLGGKTTLNYMYTDEPDKHFMQLATNLNAVNGQTFVLGRRVHHTNFGDGSHDEDPENPDFLEMAGKLGPHFSNGACIDCHAKNGRALPPALNDPLRTHVIQVGDGNGNDHPLLGEYLQSQSTSGSPEGNVRISEWIEENGLRRPRYSFDNITPAQHSIRIAPALIGMGLLDAIPEDSIAAAADPTDADGDGISGRVNIVEDPITGEPRIGRYGWKASQASVKDQVASALNFDMGVMNSRFPVPDKGAQQTDVGPSGNELPDEHLETLTAYVSLLGLRPQRDYNDPQVVRGQQLFKSIGCASCHTPMHQTGDHHPHAELRNQTIFPYTDLLLHDMGPGLADNLGEGEASGSEWRTAPLWNIGLTADVSGGEGYLHDGRARNLREAIRWHGGEGQAAKDAFVALDEESKAALIRFLKSL